MFGISQQGFKRKQYKDILEDMHIRAKEYFGHDINLSLSSPLGIFLSIIAWSLSLLWQVLEHIYNQNNLHSAEGINLDYLCERAAIYRFPALKSIGYVIISGKRNKTIYKGFRVGKIDGTIYETVENTTIGENGKAKVLVQSVEKGSFNNAEVNEIIKIINPEIDIDSVNNEEKIITGRDIETDEQLRQRYELSFTATGKATLDSIRTHILKIPTVKSVVVLENDTMIEKNGIDPKSVKVIVFGGTNEEIASAILDSKAGGISTSGNIQVMATDNIGEKHLIKFDRATNTDIFVNVKLYVENNAKINEEMLKKEVIETILKVISNVNMGKKLILNEIISAILSSNEIVKDIILKIGTVQGSLSISNIQLQSNQIATTDNEKIEISIIQEG